MAKAKPRKLNKEAGQAPAAASASGAPASRTGKKVVSGYFDPAVSRLLRAIALEEDTSLQALLGEAINDLLAKRGRPPVA